MHNISLPSLKYRHLHQFFLDSTTLPTRYSYPLLLLYSRSNMLKMLKMLSLLSCFCYLLHLLPTWTVTTQTHDGPPAKRIRYLNALAAGPAHIMENLYHYPTLKEWLGMSQDSVQSLVLHLLACCTLSNLFQSSVVPVVDDLAIFSRYLLPSMICSFHRICFSLRLMSLCHLSACQFLPRHQSIHFSLCCLTSTGIIN